MLQFLLQAVSCLYKEEMIAISFSVEKNVKFPLALVFILALR